MFKLFMYIDKYSGRRSIWLYRKNEFAEKFYVKAEI